MDTICSIDPCPSARALVTVVDHGERADFYVRAMDTEFDMPWALTAAVEIAAANGLGLIDAFEGMAYGGIYAPDYPVKERIFERLEEEDAVLLLQRFRQRDGWLGKKVGFNFDTGQLLMEHDQKLFKEPMPDGSWKIEDRVFQKLGRPLPAVVDRELPALTPNLLL